MYAFKCEEVEEWYHLFVRIISAEYLEKASNMWGVKPGTWFH